MHDQLGRLVTMLTLLPRYPRKVSVADLVSRLKDRGFRVSRRMVERDLNKIVQTQFPVQHDDAHPQGWSWGPGAQIADIPCMSPDTALMFTMVREQLGYQLPRPTLRSLEHHFAKADEVLGADVARRALNWRRRIAVLPRWMELRPPPVASEVVDAVYQAVLENRRLYLRYRSRDAEQPADRVVDPIGLVFRGSLIYLVCHSEHHGRTIQLLLHRMVTAQVLEQAAQVPEGEDLDSYLAAGGFNYGATGEIMRLKVRFTREAAIQLRETPLTQDQVLEEPDDRTLILTATVEDSWPLRWWLFSFGERAEVLEPPGLRAHFTEVVGNLARAYGVVPALEKMT